MPIHTKQTRTQSSTKQDSARSSAIHNPSSPELLQRALEQPTPETLTPDVVVQLQRLHGNQFVNSLLRKSQENNTTQDVSPSAESVVQRAKTADERSTKHKRMARAKDTIGKLKGSLSKGLVDHVFDAKPVAGGEPVKSSPTGLHGYDNGKLPKGITSEVVEGSENKVHKINWSWDGTNKKDSTMFPKWMPKNHVETLIALDFENKRQVNVAGSIYKDDAKTYIQRGLTISLKSSGDTVYPTL